VEVTASAMKKGSSVITLEFTRVAIAQSLKHSAESNLSNSEGVELSNQGAMGKMLFYLFSRMFM